MKPSRVLCVLVVIVLALILVLRRGIVISPNDHISISFTASILAKADGSRPVFQEGNGYHLGNGTHIWGQMYIMKLYRFYVIMGVLHTNPRVTGEEAGD